MENNLVIVGCKDEQLKTKVVESVKKVEGVAAVISMSADEFENYSNYMEQQTQAPKKTLADILADKENQKSASDNAIKLYQLVTGDNTLEKADERVMTEQEVCKKTTLSHKQARGLFEMLKVFGYLEWVGKQAFKLHFGAKERLEIAYRGAAALRAAYDTELAAFKALCESIEDKVVVETYNKKLEELKKQ